MRTNPSMRRPGKRSRNISTTLRGLVFFFYVCLAFTLCVNTVCPFIVLGASEITANLYCKCVYLYWEGCGICSIYLQYALIYGTPSISILQWKFSICRRFLIVCQSDITMVKFAYHLVCLSHIILKNVFQY